MADQIAKESRFRVTHPLNTARILFEGTEKDTRAWLAANFPRSHGDGFSPNAQFSAQLLHPDGKTTEVFHVDHGFGKQDSEGDVTWNDDPNAPATAPVAPVEVPVNAPVATSDAPVTNPEEGVLL